MNHNLNEVLFNIVEIKETTEELTRLTGFSLPTTSDVKRFSIIPDTTLPNIGVNNYFTGKEIIEIFQSLTDLETGHFKRFDNTEELFTDLDSE